jgi:hypothetical protein
VGKAIKYLFTFSAREDAAEKGILIQLQIFKSFYSGTEVAVAHSKSILAP